MSDPAFVLFQDGQPIVYGLGTDGRLKRVNSASWDSSRQRKRPFLQRLRCAGLQALGHAVMVLQRALAELIGWQRRYKDLLEFAELCDSIDQLQLKLTVKN